MAVTSEAFIREVTLGGRRLHVTRTTWRGKPGASYDLEDAESGEVLTTEESFGRDPSDTEIRAVLAARFGDPRP
jgi:hypothetical protein